MTTYYMNGLSATYPYRAVVFITSTYADGTVSTGSGVVVGTNDVLTASHMIYSASLGVATSISVAPGYDNGTSPYGVYYADQFDYYEWDSNRDGLVSTTEADEDIAILGFSERLSDLVGSFGLDPNFLEGPVHLTGYPGVYAGPNGSRMTDDTGSVYAADGLFYFNSDLEVNPGNSGGPIWYEGPSGPTVIGVVSSEFFGPDIYTNYSQIVNWIDGNDDLIEVAVPSTPDIIKQVARLYEAGLDRQFDAGGLNYWIDQQQAGMRLDQMAGHFLDSVEFTSRYGDDDLMSIQEFVSTMYLSTLGRTLDQEGYLYWSDRMDSGMSRDDVLLNFSESPENVAQSAYLEGLREVQPGYWDIA
jgi:V8-like Glu-specific endopeptidase